VGKCAEGRGGGGCPKCRELSRLHAPPRDVFLLNKSPVRGTGTLQAWASNTWDSGNTTAKDERDENLGRLLEREDRS